MLSLAAVAISAVECAGYRRGGRFAHGVVRASLGADAALSLPAPQAKAGDRTRSRIPMTPSSCAGSNRQRRSAEPVRQEAEAESIAALWYLTRSRAPHCDA